ncbi:AzlC family ABC transporter permease [Streptomyces sp. NPDC054784]
MRSIWRTLDRRLRLDIALVCLADGVVGMSYGAISVSAGLDLWLPLTLSVLVLAGASEILFVGIVAAGGSPAAAALGGLLVNARHVPFGLAAGDVLGRGVRRVLGSHVMNDESVVFALGQSTPDRRRAAYWACGLGILVCWPLGTLAGGLLGGVLGDPDAYGLDAMFPAVLLALVLPSLRDDARTRRTALAGAVLALAATPFLPAGLPVLAALPALLLPLGGEPGPAEGGPGPADGEPVREETAR